MKKEESKTFKLGHYFKSHKEGSMELEINDDGNYVFIVEKNIEDNQSKMEMKIWRVDTLEEVQMDIPIRINKQRVESIDLLSNNQFMMVTYTDNNEKQLQEVEIIQVSTQETVLSFNPRFSDTTGFPKEQQQKKVERRSKESRIFPLKLFIDNVAVPEPTYMEKGVGLLGTKAKDAWAIKGLKFQILFISDIKLDFVSADSSRGYPLFFVGFTLDELMKNKTDQAEFILSRAGAVFDSIFKDDESLSAIESIAGIAATTFMLDEGYIKWPKKDQDISAYTENPIEYSRFEINSAFDHLALINNKQRRECLVFSRGWSDADGPKRLCSMASERIDSEVQGQLQFVRNQRLKQGMYCLFKGQSADTQVYSFFKEDKEQIKKTFTLENDHSDARQDCLRLFTAKNQSLAADDIQVGALTLQMHS